MSRFSRKGWENFMLFFFCWMLYNKIALFIEAVLRDHKADRGSLVRLSTIPRECLSYLKNETGKMIQSFLRNLRGKIYA